MTPAEYIKRKKGRSRHGATIVWFFLTGSDPPSPVEHRATYHRKTLWKDHPWSEGRKDHGADFVNCWALESRYEGTGSWNPDGRNANGWDALTFTGKEPATLKEALLETIRLLKEDIAHHEAKADRARGALAYRMKKLLAEELRT